jgi:hypothetical protein
MDVRVKTFTAEAVGRLGALLDQQGFVGPEVEHEQGSHPLVIRVSYHRADVSVETCLVLAYAGEEYVQTVLRWHPRHADTPQQAEAGFNTAHTGYQMRRALDRHVETVREALRITQTGDPDT